jgi:hypothetical protein
MYYFSIQDCQIYLKFTKITYLPLPKIAYTAYHYVVVWSTIKEPDSYGWFVLYSLRIGIRRRLDKI